VQKGLHPGLHVNSSPLDSLRMIPQLILTQADVDEATEIMNLVLADVASLPIARV